MSRAFLCLVKNSGKNYIFTCGRLRALSLNVSDGVYDEQFELWFLYLMDSERDGSSDPYDPAHSESDHTGRYTRMGISPAEQIANDLPMDFTLDAAKEYFHRVHWEPVLNYLGRDVNPVCCWCLADVSVQSGFGRVPEYWAVESKALHDVALEHFAPNNASDYPGALRFVLAFLRRRSRGYRDITRPKVSAARSAGSMEAEAAAWRHLSGWTSRRLNLVLLEHLMRPGAPCMGALHHIPGSSQHVTWDDSSDLTQEIQHVDQSDWQRLQRARDKVAKERAELEALRGPIELPEGPYEYAPTNSSRNIKEEIDKQIARGRSSSQPAPKKPKWMRWLKAVSVGLGVAGVSVAGPAMDVAGPIIDAVSTGASVKDAVIGGVAGWLFDRSAKNGR